MRESTLVRRVAIAALVMYLLGATWVVVTPGRYHPPVPFMSQAELSRLRHQHSGVNVVPFASVVRMLTNDYPPTATRLIGLNLLFGLPLGLLIPLVIRSVRTWKQMLAIGFGFALGAELLQVALTIIYKVPYKTLDVDNVLLTSIGVCFGFALYRAVAAWRVKGARQRADLQSADGHA